MNLLQHFSFTCCVADPLDPEQDTVLITFVAREKDALAGSCLLGPAQIECFPRIAFVVVIALLLSPVCPDVLIYCVKFTLRCV